MRPCNCAFALGVNMGEPPVSFSHHSSSRSTSLFFLPSPAKPGVEDRFRPALRAYFQPFYLPSCRLESAPMNNDANIPAWIRKRDGRLVPFEPDRICQALFAATEHLGRPNVFLARELTDSVVHFLCEEATARPPTTIELAELVVKVVRELGQPDLARCFEDCVPSEPGGPVEQVRMDAVAPPHVLTRAAASIPLSEISLAEVFPRNLVSAHREGLLTLTGLEHPFELAGSVLSPAIGPAGQGIREALESARESTGSFVAIDGPDYALAQLDGAPAPLAADYSRELSAGLRATGLSAVVNLNMAQLPDRLPDLGEGPLFPRLRQSLHP